MRHLASEGQGLGAGGPFPQEVREEQATQGPRELTVP